MLVLLAHGRAQRLSVHRHPQGLLPAAGHRPPDRLHPRRPGHLVPGDAGEARAASSRSWQPIPRWRASSRSPAAGSATPARCSSALKPLQRAQGHRRPGDRAAAREARARAGREPVPARPCRTSASAGARPRRSTSTRCRPTTSTSCARGSRRSAQALSALPELADVSTDQQDKGLQTTLVIDRDAAARLGITHAADRHRAQRRLRPAAGLDDLQPAQPVPRGDGGRAAVLAEPRGAARHLRQRAGERQRRHGKRQRWHEHHDVHGRRRRPRVVDRPPAATSTAADSPSGTGNATRALGTTSGRRRRAAAAAPGSSARVGTVSAPLQVPLSAFSHYGPTNTPLAVNHQGQFAASTISFNLPEGVSLSEATDAIDAGDVEHRRAARASTARSRAPRAHSSSRCGASRC